MTTGERLKTDRFGMSESGDSLRMYLNDIGRTALLAAEDEVELAQRIEAGVYADHLLGSDDEAHREKVAEYGAKNLGRIALDGKAAYDHMVKANMRLVVDIAKRHQGRGLPLLDLIQEGNLGLMHAVKKFDYTKGFKFSTYGTTWIKQAVARGLADQARTIRLPVHTVEKVNKLERTRREMYIDLGRSPTLIELSEQTNLSVEQIVKLDEASRHVASLDTPIGDDDARLGDFVADLEDADAIELEVEFGAMQHELANVLSELDERERRVIMLRYGLIGGRPHTLDQIGGEFGLTRERIRQIEAQVMKNLRHNSKIEQLREYLD